MFVIFHFFFLQSTVRSHSNLETAFPPVSFHEGLPARDVILREALEMLVKSGRFFSGMVLGFFSRFCTLTSFRSMLWCECFVEISKAFNSKVVSFTIERFSSFRELVLLEFLLVTLVV